MERNVGNKKRDKTENMMWCKRYTGKDVRRQGGVAGWVRLGW